MGLWGSMSLLQFCTKFCGYLGFPWERVHRFPHIHKGFYFLKAGNHWAIQRYLDCGSPLPRKPGVRNQGGMGEGLVMLRTKGGYLILIFPQVTFFLCSSGLTCLYLAAQQLHTKLTGGRENSETEPEFSGGQGLASCKWGGNWKDWSFTSLTFCFPSKVSDRAQRLSRLPSHDPQPGWDTRGIAALPSTLSTWRLSHTAAQSHLCISITVISISSALCMYTRLNRI